MLEQAVQPQGTPNQSQAVKLGRIVSVAGSQVISVLDENLTKDKEMRKHVPQIGALVTMRLPESVAYGLVTGLSIPDPSGGDEGKEL